MKALFDILSFLILGYPTHAEVQQDSHGDTKKDKRKDWLRRLIWGSVAVMTSLGLHSLTTDLTVKSAITYALSAAFMSMAIHFLLFDYWIVTVLRKNGVIHKWVNTFTYLGETANYPKWWRNMKPGWRFAIRFVIFAVALVIYIHA